MAIKQNRPSPRKADGTNGVDSQLTSRTQFSEDRKGNLIFIAGGALVVAALMQFLGC